MRKFKLFQVEPTLRCNLRCSMCPWHEMRAGASDMEWNTFLAIARSFHGTEEVDLTGGGEPLIHPQLLDMIALSKKKGCRVGFSTNATMLSKELSREMAKLGLDWVAYSVDGATPHTYENIRRGASFNKVLSHISSMEELRSKTSAPYPGTTMIFFVMMRGNIHELPLMVDICVDLGIDKLIAKNLDVILAAEHDAERIFHWEPEKIDPSHQQIVHESLKRAREKGLFMRVYDFLPGELSVCEQDPLHTVFFNWEGHVSPCITLCYAQKRVFQGVWCQAPTMRLGNINETDFEEIWESRAYRAFRKQFDRRKKGIQSRFVQTIVGGSSHKIESSFSLHPIPEGCRTCHYIYGV
ncbi:MAG: radical SAM protein [Deltaproteobacteria bacterium]|nr:radical SAM protein [Deltaproteobacteria bacterium]MBW2306929.1 radical SAM protein [Deltaproteobacteria bacterium]